MSEDTNLIISVPRSRLDEFYSKYFNLVETFYYVTLSETKLCLGNGKPDFVYFNVTFNLNPADGSFNPQELLCRIQNYVESSLGWTSERGEDSSYDSECEDEGAHRAASRTPSDTLAAEFAEYVTVTPTSAQPNQAKIDFAIKLGYSEQLARIALQRLGPDPLNNDLLAELINLAAKQPPRALSPPPPTEPDPPPDRSPLRHIVIDGSNVAMSHGNKEVFSCRGIEICVEWFRARGHKEITAFVPKWRKEASRPDNPIADRDALERLERDRVLVYTPSRLVGGKRLVCYDDRYVLRLAADTDGIVVSNDNYRDLAAESPEFRKVVEERILMYSFVNDRFMPPDDPLGRTGPTLDAFLRVPASRTDPPPACPYGRKCTYGNKCKFYHPERAGRPHKSIAEKLSERASKLRSRDLHTVSLPPGGRPADVKRPLARAKSAAPRLADVTLASHFDRAQLQLTGPHQQLGLGPAHHQLMPGPGPAHQQLGPGPAHHQLAPGQPHQQLGPGQALQQLGPGQPHQQLGLGPVHQQFGPGPAHQQVGLGPVLQQLGPGSGGAQADVKPHRKLARQLTLEAARDPRLHAAAARAGSAPAGAAPAPYAPRAPLSPCTSDGALQHWDARRRMHYHLAGIFPEAQVIEAMAAHPEETDAQTMCAIILARYRPSEATFPRLPH